MIYRPLFTHYLFIHYQCSTVYFLYMPICNIHAMSTNFQLNLKGYVPCIKSHWNLQFALKITRDNIFMPQVKRMLSLEEGLFYGLYFKLSF